MFRNVTFPVAFIALGLASSAFAQQAPSVPVSTAGLNLASTEGVETLNRRIEVAVEKACGSADSRDLTMAAQVRKCRQIAFQSSRSQVEIKIAQARTPKLALASAH